MDLKRFTAQSFTPQNRARRQATSLGMDQLSSAMSKVAKGISDAQDEDDYQAGVLAYAKGVHELDREFDKDDDLGTLPQRRKERVGSLAESVYQGKSGRVQERLRYAFERNAETDDARWQAIVTKKDSAKRVARFKVDMDSYLNQMTQAETDEDFAKAQNLWQGRAEAIKPHMSPAAFITMQDKVSDYVGFTRAWNRQTGEGEFDPKPYKDLQPEQMGRLQVHHYALARERERKAAEHQADRLNVLLPRLEDSLASATTTGKPMDDTEDMLAEVGGLGKRGARAAAEYQAQFDLSATAWNVTDSVKHQPFDVQLAAVETLRPEPGSENYRSRMQMYERTAGAVAKRAKAFYADPAGVVRGEAEQRVGHVATDPWIADEDRERMTVRASMDLQREWGNSDPRVLTAGQAKQLKSQYEQANGDGKAQLLGGMAAQYGELSEKAVREMGLDYANTYAAGVYMEDEDLGRKVLQAMSIKEGDISISPEERKAVKRDAEEAFYDGPGEFFRRQYVLTGNPRYQEIGKNMLSAVTRYGLVTGDGTKAVKEMWGDRFDTVLTDHMQLVLPKDVSERKLETGLRNWVRQALPYGSPFSKEGMWVSSSDGTGFVLSLPSGKTLEDDSGKPRVVTLDELDALERVEEEQYNNMGLHRMTRSEVEW